MARPKTRPLGIRIKIDATDPIEALLKSTAASSVEGIWPGRPHPLDRIFDEPLGRMYTAYQIPRAIGVRDVRALLEHAFVIAEDAIRVERQSAPPKVIKAQIEAIAKAAVGDPMPAALHDDVYARLSYMAMWDKRFGKGGWNRLAEIQQELRCQATVTALMQDWAAWVIIFGGTTLVARRNHGGPHIEAELVFISVLINYWIDDLGRQPTTWVFEDDGDKNAEFTHFVRDCLHAVGARARARDRNGQPAGKRDLTPSDVHQRIMRVKKEMREAVGTGLKPNYLSRHLNNRKVSAPERT